MEVQQQVTNLARAAPQQRLADKHAMCIAGFDSYVLLYLFSIIIRLTHISPEKLLAGGHI